VKKHCYYTTKKCNYTIKIFSLSVDVETDELITRNIGSIETPEFYDTCT
jgi:hypothetical protein